MEGVRLAGGGGQGDTFQNVHCASVDRAMVPHQPLWAMPHLSISSILSSPPTPPPLWHITLIHKVSSLHSHELGLNKLPENMASVKEKDIKEQEDSGSPEEEEITRKLLTITVWP